MTASPGDESPGDRAAVILTPDQRVRVFISSTLEELAEERAAALRAIRRLHLVPVWFESGARPHPPQSMYRAYLEQSQIFVGIYWQRYGWVGPGMEISGLEDEFRLAAGKPMLLYLEASGPGPGAGTDRDDREYPFGGHGVVPPLRHGAGAGTAPSRRPCCIAERELRGRDGQHCCAASHRRPGRGEPGGSELPAGTLTFLLTDIEGSTRLWESEPEAMEVALQRHDRLLAEVIESHGGAVVTSRGEGDSFFAVFQSARCRRWRRPGCVSFGWRVRCGLPVVLCGCGWGCIPGRCGCAAAIIWTTTPINRCARVRAAGHGGQVLLTKATSDLVAGHLGGGFGLKQPG